MIHKVIDSKKVSFLYKIKELLRYRDLIYTLSLRDLKIRYSQTFIGFSWVIIQPLFTLLILNLVFNQIVGLKTKIPSLLFTSSGLCIWTYFSFVIMNAGNSIISNQNLIQKIYFPRLVIPISKSIVGLVDLIISLVILFLMMLYYRFQLSPQAFYAIVFIFLGMISSLGIGIWLSALTIRYRDIQHVVPFIVQIGLYATPIAYPPEFVLQKLPNWAVSLYYLNPIAGIIQGFRWSLFGGDFPDPMFFISIISVFILFISSLYYFSKIEQDMADYV